MSAAGLQHQYVLDDYENLTAAITEPLVQSLCQRIKYCCAAVSKSHIILGATSGSLYVFQRTPKCAFQRLIPSVLNQRGKAGGGVVLDRISISSKETFVAGANQRGDIFVHRLTESERNVDKLQLTRFVDREENAHKISSFYWSEDEQGLYYGDTAGNVAMVNIGQLFKGYSFLATAHYPILMLDSEIVQIDGFDLLLLVSTRTKCILCNTDREEFKQIGNRPRDGRHGACFLNKSIDEYLRGQIYCARPSLRFWEVDFGGTVKQTIQYKDVLSGTASIRPPEFDNDDNNNLHSASNQKQSNNINYNKLQEIGPHFLITFTTTAVYIFDPMNSALILWSDIGRNIEDVFVIGTTLYCIERLKDGLTVNTFQLRDKLQVFEDYLWKKEVAKLKRFILANKSSLRDKTLKVRRELEPKMKQLRETLIMEQEYECLEIISDIGFRADEDEENVNGTETDRITILMPTSLPKVNNNENWRTSKANLVSTLKSKWITFGLFSSASPPSPGELIRCTNLGSTPPKPVSDERIDLFKEITTSFSSVNDPVLVVTDTNKRKFFTNRKFRKFSELLKSNEANEPDSAKESKMLKNLFLIFKSSSIGNVNLVERYAPIFEKYEMRELLRLLVKLEVLMIDNEYTEVEAKKNTTRILLDYLKPEMVATVDAESLEILINRYIFINAESEGASGSACSQCGFPIRLLLNTKAGCGIQYLSFGTSFVDLLNERGETERFHNLIKAVPLLLTVTDKYFKEGDKNNLALMFLLRQFNGRHQWSEENWSFVFQLMSDLLSENLLRCFYCDHQQRWDGSNPPADEYSWDVLLNQAARFLGGPTLLKMVLKHAKTIANGTISKDFYLKCLQTA